MVIERNINPDISNQQGILSRARNALGVRIPHPNFLVYNEDSFMFHINYNQTESLIVNYYT